MPQFTTQDNTHIFYATHGMEHPRQAVVFLNGMTQSTQHWSSHARAFSEHFSVITYDARGQGQSEVGSQPLTLELHAHDLHGLLNHLGIERAHLVGFSHGARVSLSFAAHYPANIDKLVLCSASAKPSALARVIVRSWQEVLKHGGLEAMAWSALPTILGERFLAQSERMLNNIIKASMQRNTAEGVQALLEGLVKYPDLDELATHVKAPTLVLSSTEDLLVTSEGAKLLATLCNGEHHEVDGVGHTIPIEAPREFRKIVMEFLQD